MSDATQVPMSPLGGDTPTETFGTEIEWDGVTFNTVKLFHPRKGSSRHRDLLIFRGFTISRRFDGHRIPS